MVAKRREVDSIRRYISGWICNIIGIALGVYTIATISNDLRQNSLFGIPSAYSAPFSDQAILIIVLGIVAGILVLTGIILLVAANVDSIRRYISGWMCTGIGLALGIYTFVAISNGVKQSISIGKYNAYSVPFSDHEILVVLLGVAAGIFMLSGIIMLVAHRKER